MAELFVGSSGGAGVMRRLASADIDPSSGLSYELAKDFYVLHPLGKKLVDTPIDMALEKGREFHCEGEDEEELLKAFNDASKAIDTDRLARQAGRLARVYGSSVLMAGAYNPATPGGDSAGTLPLNQPINPNDIPTLNMYFNVLDPLNTAGSMVMNQDPTAPDFLKPVTVTVNGKPIARNRRVILLNEDPIYLAYTTSAFGFSGRSVFQRALIPLVTYLDILRANRMVARKVGLLVAKIKQSGAIASHIIEKSQANKRDMVKMGETDDVVSIGEHDEITSLNLQNIDGAGEWARKNTLEDVAASSDMPIQVVSAQTYAAGFGEGSEDAKKVAAWVGGVRKWIEPVFEFLDAIAQRKGWTPEFYQSLQQRFPAKYQGCSYEAAFQSWVERFSTEWPNLLTEPDSEKVKVDETKSRIILAAAQALAPMVPPSQRAKLATMIADMINTSKALTDVTLELDEDEIEAWLIEQEASAPSSEDANPSAEREFGMELD